MTVNDDKFVPVVRSGDKSGIGFHYENQMEVVRDEIEGFKNDEEQGVVSQFYLRCVHMWVVLVVGSPLP